MPDKTTVETNVDVTSTLEELHQVAEVTELDTSGIDAGPLGQVHPIGWSVLGLLVVAVVMSFMDTEWLLGNLVWWHWVGLIAIAAISLRPAWIKQLSVVIDGVTDFTTEGANRFEHAWSAFVASAVVVVLGALFVGPLQGLADWIFGVEVVPQGPDFEITSSGSTGWIRTIIAIVVIGVALVALVRVLRPMLPSGKISTPAGAWMGVAAFVATFVVVWIVSGSWQSGVTTGFAIGILTAALAIGPLWVVSWGIFITIIFYVVTRYSARYLEADIIIGEVNSLGLQLFGVLSLLGIGYGVKGGVNPRIDFWWAEFSNKTKAWLDFVLHALLLVPFLWAALRLLQGYAKTNLGFKTDFSGETDGRWPASWHVWETWLQSSDAGNLPVGPIRALIFVGFFMFLAQIVSEMIKSGFVMIRREDLADLSVVEAPTRIE